jgi:predicted ArsR family transcriptional regulator
MDENGACQIRQRAIARRLGISLQAANKQFRFLETEGFLASTEIKIGLPKSYSLRLPDPNLQPP